MNYSTKVCAHDKIIVVLNADKEKYLNYETSASGNTIGNVCMRCHDSEKLDFFGVPKNFNRVNGGYSRVSLPEKLVLKENANLKIIVDDRGQLLATASGNPLPVDKSYHHLSGVSILKRTRRRRQAYSCNNVINHILSICQNCHLCKNNVTIDSEIAGRIKRTLADNIINEYKDELTESEAQVY